MIIAIANLSFPDYNNLMFGDSWLVEKAGRIKQFQSWAKAFPQNKIIKYFATSTLALKIMISCIIHHDDIRIIKPLLLFIQKPGILRFQAFVNYTFLSTAFNTDNRKTIKNAISTGVKTSNQPIPPIITFIINRIALNTTPNKISTSLRLLPFAIIFLVLLLATGDIS